MPRKSIDLFSFAYNAAKTVGSTFADPQDDWVPVLFYQNEAGEFHVQMILMGEGTRVEAAEAIKDILKQQKAVEAMLLMAAWTVVRDKNEFNSGASIVPSEEPDKKEVLVFSHVTQDKAEIAMADIIRYEEDPPTLGELGEKADGTVISGLFIDSMRIGIG